LFFELSAGKIVRTARYHQNVLRTDAEKNVIETSTHRIRIYRYYIYISFYRRVTTTGNNIDRT
jgi:hypothetical protein